MRKLIPMVLVLVAAGFLLNVAAFAATTGDVAATVTAEKISVVITDGDVSYGALPLGSSTSTIGVDQQTATNDGNVAEDFNIIGSDSADWALMANAGDEQYKHEFTTNGSFPGTALATTSYATLATNVAASATSTFDLQITAPTISTHFTQQSVNVTVQAVAH